jgi:hypothetical protein
MKDILTQLGFPMFHSDCVTPALAEFPVRFTHFTMSHGTSAGLS